jgi:hypothetical protein
LTIASRAATGGTLGSSLRRRRPISTPCRACFLHERHGLVNGADKIRSDFGAIEDATPVDALESTDLDPGIWEVLVARLAEQQQPTDRSNPATLVTCHEAQRLQVHTAKPSNRREQL